MEALSNILQASKQSSYILKKILIALTRTYSVFEIFIDKERRVGLVRVDLAITESFSKQRQSLI